MSPNGVVSEITEDFRNSSFFGVDWFFRSFQDSSPPNNQIPDSKTPEKVHEDVGIPVLTEENKKVQDPHPLQSRLRAPPRHPRSSPPPKSQTLAFRSQNETIGNAWNCKGLQNAKKEQWGAAAQCWERALKLRIDCYGHCHVEVANVLNNLGIAYGQLGRYGEASKSLEKALKIRARVHGRNHDDVAATLHNLGNLRQSTQEFAGALKAFREALSIQQRLVADDTTSSAPTDPKVARCWNAIGHLHYSQQNFPKARDAYRAALGAFERAGLGDDNVEYCTTKLDFEEAKELACKTC
jgi:tetratricopeptide (TPR) repeat protein